MSSTKKKPKTKIKTRTTRKNMTGELGRGWWKRLRNKKDGNNVKPKKQRENQEKLRQEMFKNSIKLQDIELITTEETEQKKTIKTAIEGAIETAVKAKVAEKEEAASTLKKLEKAVETAVKEVEEEERVKREAKEKAKEDKKAYVQEQIDIVQKKQKQTITVIETAVETAVEKEVYDVIKIEFNSKKKNKNKEENKKKPYFDPNKLIPDNLKPYIKYDEERTQKAKREKEKAKAKKRRRHHRRAGMEENLGIFKVSKDVNLKLKDLRNVIKNHTATLNENTDKPIVIPNSIKIFEYNYDSKNEEEAWQEVKEEAKQAQVEVGKKYSNKIVVQIKYFIKNISKLESILKTLIPEKEKKYIKMLPDDIYEGNESPKFFDRVTNTASVVADVIATVSLSDATESSVPLSDHSSGQGKKYIKVTFISELTRKETIRVLKKQAKRWWSGIEFAKSIEEKNNTIRVDEALEKLEQLEQKQTITVIETAVETAVEKEKAVEKEEEGKEEEKKLTRMQRIFRKKILPQDVKLIEKEEEREKKEEERKKKLKSKYTEALEFYDKEEKEENKPFEITIKFNSKKYKVFDPNNLIPDYLKPYIKYDGKATEKAKEKKGGSRRGAGQKPNSAIFHVKDKKYLYYLRYVIEDHAATLNINPKNPRVITESITIYNEGKKEPLELETSKDYILGEALKDKDIIEDAAIDEMLKENQYNEDNIEQLIENKVKEVKAQAEQAQAEQAQAEQAQAEQAQAEQAQAEQTEDEEEEINKWNEDYKVVVNIEYEIDDADKINLKSILETLIPEVNKQDIAMVSVINKDKSTKNLNASNSRSLTTYLPVTGSGALELASLISGGGKKIRIIVTFKSKLNREKTIEVLETHAQSLNDSGIRFVNSIEEGVDSIIKNVVDKIKNVVDKIKKDTTLSIDEKNEQFKNIITFIHYFIKKLFPKGTISKYEVETEYRNELMDSNDNLFFEYGNNLLKDNDTEDKSKAKAIDYFVKISKNINNDFKTWTGIKKKLLELIKNIKKEINLKVDLKYLANIENRLEDILSNAFNMNYDFVLFNFIIERNDSSLFYYNDKTYIIKNNGITSDKFEILFKDLKEKSSQSGGARVFRSRRKLQAMIEEEKKKFKAYCADGLDKYCKKFKDLYGKLPGKTKLSKKSDYAKILHFKPKWKNSAFFVPIEGNPVMENIVKYPIKKNSFFSDIDLDLEANYESIGQAIYSCCSIHFKDEIQFKHQLKNQSMDLFHYVQKANFKIVEKMVSTLESDHFKGIVKILPHHDE